MLIGVDSIDEMRNGHSQAEREHAKKNSQKYMILHHKLLTYKRPP